MHHLKSIAYLLFFCFVFQTCKAQKTATVLPKIKNYDKGELTIKISLDGAIGNEIEVGKIKPDGTIHFNWQEINTTEDDSYLNSIKRAVGMVFCNQKEIEQDNLDAKAVRIKNLSLYKYGQPVGSLFPATQKEMEGNGGSNRHSGLILGSTLSWIYSDNTVLFNAKCGVMKQWEDSYDFIETTTYTMQIKKGWNIMQTALVEKEDWTSATEKGSLPKLTKVTVVPTIPSTMNWYLKYWANDTYLEIEQHLPKLKPITPEQYKNWIPKKIGDLERVDFEIGKTLERRTSTDNINLIFEKGAKKVDVTILDCAGSERSAKDYTMMFGMVSKEWKDEKDTGYKNVSKMDEISVMTEYNSEEKTTNLYFNSNDRFSILAKGIDLKPEELWDILKDLKLNNLK